MRLATGADLVTGSEFPRIDVTTWDLDAAETGGAEEKYWLRSPEGEKWLFKPVTIKNGHRHGEDWAEKAACHLAETMSVPCARVELAVREGVEGSIARDLRPDAYELQPGYVFLQACNIEGYVPGNVPGRPGHSLANIQRALDGALPPPGCGLPDGFTAFDVFCGYVVFDAWIANRDRHDENWAVLVPRIGDDPTRLCGSYDHASSLGFNVRPQEMSERLNGQRPDVRAWAERGTAHRFEHDPAEPIPTLVAKAVEALSLATENARHYWRQCIDALDDGGDIYAKLGGMSEVARTFAVTLLDINARRLRHECLD